MKEYVKLISLAVILFFATNLIQNEAFVFGFWVLFLVLTIFYAFKNWCDAFLFYLAALSIGRSLDVSDGVSYGLITVNILGIPIYFIAGILMLAVGPGKFPRRLIYNSLFIVFLLIFIGSLTAVISGSIFSDLWFKYYRNDLKPFIIYLIGLCLMVKLLVNYIHTIEGYIQFICKLGITIGINVIFEIIYDNIVSVPQLEYSWQPHVVMPILFATLITTRFDFKIPVFIAGGLKIARGEILNIFLLTLAFSVAIPVKKYLLLLRAILLLSFFLTITTYVLSSVAPSLYDFFIFKLSSLMVLNVNDYVGSNSIGLRVVELKNIIHENNAGFYTALFGKGLGGYFTFTEFHPLREFHDGDFDVIQEAQGQFFRPHHFVNFVILKAGLVGLASYLFLFLWLWFKGRDALRNHPGNHSKQWLSAYLIGLSIYGPHAYWQPVVIILISGAIVLIKLHRL